MSEKTVESLSKALGCVQQLRSSVCDAFQFLAAGNTEAGGDEEAQRKQYVNALKEALNTVTWRLHDVEESVNVLQVAPGTFQLGNTGQLSHDPTADMQVLYGQLLDSYKWTEKVRDYATFAGPVWSQNAMKRSQNTLLKKRRTTQTSHCQPQQHVDALLNAMGRSFMDMRLSISRPCGANSAVVQVTLDRVLQAVITFKGLLIEWVMIRGFDEPMTTEDGRVDLWTPSEYQVFRKVSENAQAAMVHYYGPLHPEFSARSYLTWIHSYVNLFSAPCVKCGSRLQTAMPPTWRDLKTLQPYHEDCKS